MRIIEYPPAEPEIETRCPHCKALLGYTASECLWQDSYFSSQKYIKCAYCSRKIILESIPYPIIAGKKTITFSDGSWTEEVSP